MYVLIVRSYASIIANVMLTIRHPYPSLTDATRKMANTPKPSLAQRQKVWGNERYRHPRRLARVSEDFPCLLLYCWITQAEFLARRPRPSPGPVRLVIAELARRLRQWLWTAILESMAPFPTPERPQRKLTRTREPLRYEYLTVLAPRWCVEGRPSPVSELFAHPDTPGNVGRPIDVG